ncbi:hypothetical protein NPIL_645921, partial [Nephila pilipes]
LTGCIPDRFHFCQYQQQKRNDVDDQMLPFVCWHVVFGALCDLRAKEEELCRTWLHGRLRQSQIRQIGQSVRRVLPTVQRARCTHIMQVQLLQEQLLHPVRGCLVAAERPATPGHHGRGTLRKKAMISGFEKEENNPTHTIPKP